MTTSLTTYIAKDPVAKKDVLPNIIVIVADDMGWDGFGNHVGTTGLKAKTPVIDSLSSSGITFTNFWSNPECAPTRAAMLTGRYGFRTGIGGVGGSSSTTLNQNETVIQNYINSKTADSYATALIGKWHLSGNKTVNAPENFGIGYFSGFLSGAVQDYYEWTRTSNGKQEMVTSYTTTYLVDQSIMWIKEQTKPFMMWLAFNAPHSPFQRPPKNLITDKELLVYQQSPLPDSKAYYLSSIQAMDKEIGRLIRSLNNQQLENTIFIFIGDNGTPAKVVQKPFTASTSKSSLFQGGINTPFIVSGKGVNRKNSIETAMVQATDVFVTLAEIAGITKNDPKDGKSTKPLFSDPKAPKRTFSYSELFGSAQPDKDGYALRNTKYKLIHLNIGKDYLFNISEDPFEKLNLLDHTLNAEAQENLEALKTIKSSL